MGTYAVCPRTQWRYDKNIAVHDNYLRCRVVAWCWCRPCKHVRVWRSTWSPWWSVLGSGFPAYTGDTMKLKKKHPQVFRPSGGLHTFVATINTSLREKARLRSGRNSVLEPYIKTLKVQKRRRNAVGIFEDTLGSRRLLPARAITTPRIVKSRTRFRAAARREPFPRSHIAVRTRSK